MYDLISIADYFYNVFDASLSLEIRGVSLDIFKAFDMVSHKSLLYEVKCIGVERNFENYWNSNRYWYVVLNGQASFWLDVKTGVPQESIVCSLFFFIYINDLYENLNQLSNVLQTIHQYFMLFGTPIRPLKF